MLLHVHIEQTVEYFQTGWSIGFCDSCNEIGVVRFEDMRRVTWVYIFRAGTEKIGEVCHCDFCEREVARLLVPERVEISQWNRTEGVQSLATKLELAATPPAPSSSDQRLLSLLSHVDWTTHPRQLDISTGLIAGLIVGALSGGPIGYVLLPGIFPQLDEIGTIFAGILGGLVFGALIGALGWLLWRQMSTPAAKLRAAYLRYPFDCRRLRELAQSCRWQVQRAARRLADDVAGRRHGTTCPEFCGRRARRYASS